MARGVNKVIAIGNLGSDPDSRFLPSGQQVTNFSIAASERWTDKQTGEVKERTEWINCECWGKLAEICAQYLTRGSQCYIEGKLQTDKWEDQQTGQTRYRTKVRLDQVQFLGGGREGHRTEPQGQQQRPEPDPQQEFDDDIPF